MPRTRRQRVKHLSPGFSLCADHADLFAGSDGLSAADLFIWKLGHLDLPGADLPDHCMSDRTCDVGANLRFWEESRRRHGTVLW